VEHANGAASAEVGNLIADVEDLLDKVAHVADLDVVKLRERLRHKVGAARAGVLASGRRIGRAASTATTTTDNYVHKSPWQAVGIAAGVGAALGYLLARR
jgi:ElaB/YqjD/DUF883 family membrane-anchored ribosome-binding protein